MTKKFVLALLVAAAPSAALQAQNMPLPQFLTKATALEKKGAMAIFSGDLRLLQKEIKQSMPVLRQERLAAEKAGRKGAFCPRAGHKVEIGAKELLTYFRSIPPAQREQMRVKDGMRSFMARRMPCPA